MLLTEVQILQAVQAVRFGFHMSDLAKVWECERNILKLAEKKCDKLLPNRLKI